MDGMVAWWFSLVLVVSQIELLLQEDSFVQPTGFGLGRETHILELLREEHQARRFLGVQDIGPFEALETDDFRQPDIFKRGSDWEGGAGILVLVESRGVNRVEGALPVPCAQDVVDTV